MFSPSNNFIYFLLLIVMLGESFTAAQEKKMKYNTLSKEEERVIIHKGTEKPFTGKYYNHDAKGVYSCKRCNTPLFRSQDKFDAGCGWPSFDEAIPGAVTRQLDADGVREEIICSNCGAHLGHVFLGEGFTAKDVRHCVNSISLNFIPAQKIQVQKAAFAGGCFWGVEYYFQKEKGVISTRVGYTGGTKENPTYEEVCQGKTGHFEAVEVTFDPSRISYEDLAKLFFEIHDPTQQDGQGPDIGEQYKSVIFYNNEKQKKTAQKLIDILEKKGYKVATQLRKAGTFWEAELYHQDYYQKKNTLPYCHVRTHRF